MIYGLVDPRTLLVRYVGMSSTGMRRPNDHGRPAALAKDKTHKGKWIRALRRNGYDYEIVILDEVEDLVIAERWWIAFGRACGWPLTNHTDGGEGAPGVKRSVLSRQRQSSTLKQIGHQPSLEARNKACDILRGVPRTPSQRHAVSEANRKRVVSEETRSKMRAARVGRKFPRTLLEWVK